MEEKRREAGSDSPAAAASAGSSVKSVESPATEPPAPRRRGQKRKLTSSSTLGSSSAPPKRHAREKAAAAAAAASAGLSSLFPAIHNGPLTRARQLSDNNAAITSALNAINNEQTKAAADAVGGGDGREEVNVIKDDYEALEAAIEAEFKSIRSRGENAHVVPVAAGWFSWLNIHPIEKQTMHSFFNGKSESRTPETYMEIRNWIMKRFHANPETNIELKDLSELSTGDSDARQEVMELLDHWGLINYHPFPLNDPTDIDAIPSTDVDNKEDKTDSLIEKLYQFETEESNQQVFLRASSSTLAMPTGLFRESTIAEELVKQEGPAVEYHCNSCSADCSRKRYHCQKQADFDLCTECYNNGKFGSGMYPSDFILMEPGDASSASGGKWTDQETLLLLEALELYKENWNEIAEHVATKTKAQCILHFLQMPIEDGFLDYNEKDIIQETAEPTSANNDLPAPKDNSEPSEGKNGKDSSEPAEGENGKLNSEKSEGKTGENDQDLPEGKTDTNAVQPISSPMEISNLEDDQGEKGSHHRDDEIVLKALKEAFGVVGSPPTLEDKYSFAEVGNPVMALAAFMTRMVDPEVATASSRASLKLMSKSSAGSHLAARHCFVLEDPPDEKKDQNGYKSTATEKIDQNGPEQSENSKNINCNAETCANQSDGKSIPVLDGTCSTDNHICEKDSASGEDVKSPSRGQDLCAEKFQGGQKPNEEKFQVAEKSNEARSQAAETPIEVKSQVGEKSDEEKSQLMENPDKCTSSEQPGLMVLNDSQNPALPNDVLPASKKDQDSSACNDKTLGSANESTKVDDSGETVQCAEVPKDVDMESSPVPSDKKEHPDKTMPVAMVKVGSQTVDNMEVDKNADPKSMEIIKEKDYSNVAKLKRAALATLSAAAVKAKLLAKQEEDEIRQLATLLIEKQLRKLEIKLSYFTEMENGIIRVREQLERSRQKLFNERAQIIASRLGLSASSSRVLPSSLPMSRMPPGLLNSMLRPPVTMAGQRLSIPRPGMTSALQPINTSGPHEVSGGGPMQPSDQGKPSSVGTN